eukprot:TRINITY_DN3446_c0_g1_i4.p1 TRINITY_DN3446_c0_g1~~TRINITY_DN3446_c0_g1_i4.p1  ORF type:complete len:1184 (-),score=498.30 TRINITY_DN3446_c0_g1_i4:46-3597(-)
MRGDLTRNEQSNAPSPLDSTLLLPKDANYSSASLKRGLTLQSIMNGNANNNTNAGTKRTFDTRIEVMRSKSTQIFNAQLHLLQSIQKYADGIEETTKKRKILEDSLSSLYLPLDSSMISSPSSSKDNFLDRFQSGNASREEKKEEKFASVREKEKDATTEKKISIIDMFTNGKESSNPSAREATMASSISHPPPQNSAANLTKEEREKENTDVVNGDKSLEKSLNKEINWDQSKIGFLAGGFCKEDAFMKCSEGVEKRLTELSAAIVSCKEVCENIKNTFKDRLSMHDSLEDKYEKMRKKSKRATKGFNNLKELSDMKNAFEEFRDKLLIDFENYVEQRQDPCDPVLLALVKLQKEMRDGISNGFEYESKIDLGEKRVENVANSVKTTLFSAKEQEPTFLDTENVDFESFLNNEMCLIYFRNFLESEFSLENLNFHIQMKELISLPSGSQKSTEALRIYDTFVKEHSVFEVNISSPIKEAVKRVFEPSSEGSIENSSEYSEKNREEALIKPWREVLILMKTDSFDRFKKSQHFLRLYERLTARNFRNYSMPLVFAETKSRLQRGGSISSMSGAEESYSPPPRSPTTLSPENPRNFFSDSAYNLGNHGTSPVSIQNQNIPSILLVSPPKEVKKNEEKDKKSGENSEEKEKKTIKSDSKSNNESLKERNGTKPVVENKPLAVEGLKSPPSKLERKGSVPKQMKKVQTEDPRKFGAQHSRSFFTEKPEFSTPPIVLLSPPPKSDGIDGSNSSDSLLSPSNFEGPALPMKLSEEALKRRADYHSSRSVSMTNYSSNSESGSTRNLRSRIFPSKRKNSGLGSPASKGQEEKKEDPIKDSNSPTFNAQSSGSSHHSGNSEEEKGNVAARGSIWKTISGRFRGKKSADSSPDTPASPGTSPRTIRHVSSKEKEKEKEKEREKENRKSFFPFGKKRGNTKGKEMVNSNSLDYASYGASPFAIDPSEPTVALNTTTTKSMAAFPQRPLPKSTSNDGSNSQNSTQTIEEEVKEGGEKKVSFAMIQRTRSASSLSNSESANSSFNTGEGKKRMGTSMAKSRSEARPKVESPDKNEVRERSKTSTKMSAGDEDLSIDALIYSSNKKDKRISIRDEFLRADARFSEATERRNQQRDQRKKQREEELRAAEEASRLNEEKRRIREENRKLEEDAEKLQLEASKKNQDQRRRRLEELD